VDVVLRIRFILEDSPSVYGFVIVLEQETSVIPVVNIHAQIGVGSIFDIVAELHKEFSIVFILMVQLQSQFFGPNITRVTPSAIEKLVAPRVADLHESVLFT